MVQTLRIMAVLCCCAYVHAKMPDMVFVVETTVVKPRPQFLIERRYVGTIKAEKFSILSPKSAGTVASINSKAGERVKKGQLLVSLTSESEATSVELALKGLSLAQEKLARSKKLYASQDITKSQLDEAQSEVLRAKEKLSSQKERKENVELRAPFDGIVGVTRVAIGELIKPDTPVVSVIDGPFFVFINIPASRLSEVKPKQIVKIKSATATIDAVERSIDPNTRTGFAKVILPSCENCIVGDSVYVHINVYEKNNVILINKDAFYYKNQKPQIVVVVKDEKQKLIGEIREIVIGEEQEGLVEVLSGLKEGDEIVAVNPKRIPDKANLSVVK